MGYIDLQRVKGLTVCGAANLLLKVHVLWSAKSQTAFIAGGIQMDTDAAFRVDPFPTSVFTVSGKNQNMVPAGTTVIHQEAKVTGQQLGLIDGVGVVPLTVGTSMQAHAYRSLIGPVCKAGTIKTKGTNRACGTGTCRSHQFGGIPLIVPACFTLTSPEVWDLSNQGKRRGKNVLAGCITVLPVDKSDQLRICQRNSRSASKGSVQGHFQRICHVLNDFSVGQLELRVFCRHINAKRISNDGIVKRMDGTDCVLNDFRSRLQGFLPVSFIVACGSGTGDSATGVSRYGYGNRLVLCNRDLLLGFFGLIREIIGSLLGVIVVSGDTVHDAGSLNSGNNGHSRGFIGGIRHRNQTFMLFYFIGNRKHPVSNRIQLCYHIVHRGTLLL